MNRSTVTPTDLFVLETLTWRLRVAGSEQLRLAVGQGPRGWERRCERLLKQQLIRSRVVVLSVISVSEPLVVRFPRDPAPNFDALSWHVSQRWISAKRESIRLLWGTKQAEAIVGGLSGAERQPLQVVHDLGVASVFWERCRTIGSTANRWLSEDLFRLQFPKQAQGKVPDAVILDEDRFVQTAIEFAGHYSAERLRRLFQYWQQRRTTIELW